MKDKINPNYYKDNPIQTFDAITSQFTDAERLELSNLISASTSCEWVRK